MITDRIGKFAARLEYIIDIDAWDRSARKWNSFAPDSADDVTLELAVCELGSLLRRASKAYLEYVSILENEDLNDYRSSMVLEYKNFAFRRVNWAEKNLNLVQEVIKRRKFQRSVW